MAVVHCDARDKIIAVAFPRRHSDFEHVIRLLQGQRLALAEVQHLDVVVYCLAGAVHRQLPCRHIHAPHVRPLLSAALSLITILQNQTAHTFLSC